MRWGGFWDQYTPRDLDKYPKWLLAALVWEAANITAAFDDDAAKRTWIADTITLIQQRKPFKLSHKKEPTS